MMTTVFCVPGDRICQFDSNLKSGPGTYIENGFIHSSLAGILKSCNDDSGKKLVTVIRNQKSQRILPQTGDIVTCLISSIQTNVAMCLIKCVGAEPLKQPFKAMIYKDVPDVTKICLPGDIVIGKVVGNGDNGRYLVSIVDKEFGVAIPTNESLSSRKFAQI